MDKISVIIPVYNSEDTIERCLNSILNQTYNNFEVICIDDGSIDKSKKIIQKYLYDNRVKYLYQKNAGVSSARNTGINHAIGKYIIFIDSDDYIEMNMFENLMSTLYNTNSDLVICNYNIVNGNNFTKNISAKEKSFTRQEFYNDFIKYYKKTLINQPWNKIYKKKYIKDFFNVNKNLGEDLEFNIKYIKNINKIYFINKFLYNYDISSENSLSKSFDLNEQNNDFFELYNIIYKNSKFNYNSILGLDVFIVKNYAKYVCNIQKNKNYFEYYSKLKKFYDNFDKKSNIRKLIYSKYIFSFYVFLFKIRRRLKNEKSCNINNK